MRLYVWPEGESSMGGGELSCGRIDHADGELSWERRDVTANRRSRGRLVCGANSPITWFDTINETYYTIAWERNECDRTTSQQMSSSVDGSSTRVQSFVRNAGTEFMAVSCCGVYILVLLSAEFRIRWLFGEKSSADISIDNIID